MCQGKRCWPIAIARRSSATEFLRFLNRLERDIPADKLVHVVLDNDGSHTYPKVRAGPARHRRWTFHFTPTSASWLNAVEGFFAKPTRRRLQRGVFHFLVDFQAAINRHLADHNASPETIHLGGRPRYHCCGKPRVPNVSFDPLTPHNRPDLPERSIRGNAGLTAQIAEQHGRVRITTPHRIRPNLATSAQPIHYVARDSNSRDRFRALAISSTPHCAQIDASAGHRFPAPMRSTPRREPWTNSA